MNEDLQTRETMLRAMDRPFVPGFETEAKARRAGQKFFARANGSPGKEGRDFHLVQNEHGRWHFEEGKQRASR